MGLRHARTKLRPRSMGFALGAGGLAAGFLALRIWPPGTAGFYPPCPIHQFTGLLCPGCGGTRALSALAHGHVLEALRWNALTTLLLPAALLWSAYVFWQSWRGHPLPWTPPPAVSYALLAAAVLFTVLRNLPLHLFLLPGA